MAEIFLSVISSFSLQLIAAELLFCFYLKKRRFFLPRLLVCVCAFVGLTYDLPFMLVFGVLSLRFVFTFAVSVLIMWFCFDVPFRSVLFCAVSGYAVRGLSQNVYVFGEFLRGGIVDLKTDWLHYSIYVFCYVLCFFIFATRLAKKDAVDISNIKLSIAAVIVVVIDGFCGMWRYVFNLPMNPVCPLYGFISCVLALLVLYSFFKESELSKQNAMMTQLLRKEQEQFEISRENVEALNMKCHDIKQNLIILNKIKKDGDTERYCRELEKVASAYDDIVKTGNGALDVVLMEKKLLFGKHAITFTYIADGQSLSGLSSVDIYSLFGNILNNALQCEIAERDKDKRFVSLKVYEKASHLFIHADNYCSAPIEFVNGLPVTTKSDKENHGFGTKSIKYIVGTYCGIVEFSHNNDRFNVDILIPLQR